jgi:hypothetical protein
MSSNARSIWPSQRMTWWMRPGPSRLRDAEAVASSPSVFSTGTRTPV